MSRYALAHFFAHKHRFQNEILHPFISTNFEYLLRNKNTYLSCFMYICYTKQERCAVSRPTKINLYTHYSFSNQPHSTYTHAQTHPFTIPSEHFAATIIMQLFTIRSRSQRLYIRWHARFKHWRTHGWPSWF